MKTLFILRHAKSSWDYPNIEDYERPLLEEGIRKTKKIARFLEQEKCLPELIKSSHAVRARETAKIIGKTAGDSIRVESVHNLYEANINKIYEVIFETEDTIDKLMIVGHNPTFTYFANEFNGNTIDWLPTSGIVCIDFDTDKWEGIPTAKASTRFYIIPKMLKETGKIKKKFSANDE